VEANITYNSSDAVDMPRTVHVIGTSLEDVIAEAYNLIGDGEIVISIRFNVAIGENSWSFLGEPT
jgi:hypothetical protein